MNAGIQSHLVIIFLEYVTINQIGCLWKKTLLHGFEQDY